MIRRAASSKIEDAPAAVSKKVLMSRSASSEMNSMRYFSTEGMTPEAPCWTTEVRR